MQVRNSGRAQWGQLISAPLWLDGAGGRKAAPVPSLGPCFPSQGLLAAVYVAADFQEDEGEAS